ncbi:MAG: winged helix-turn-helix domain-containing protein [Rhodospirillales bacterium]|nr:winged helix-turn-helix domain-containing protein [Rhodospirillales bacterium]MCB9965857.1 winged helix-turn-helix domain-containing protein [Rhodospirillales bacterium]MCB9973382.1 winged helix-turn-helix domain-containing protein [Rhodospirillales bacterium]MCB9979658.1 winged helix-turn-helix domain-containing protein [Rhodospirillales bacterium]
MGYHKEFPVGTAERLEGLLKEAGDNEAFRRVQSVYFRAKFGYPAPQIAAMTGYSVGTVRNVHSAFLRDGFAIFDLGRPGGRQAAYMTPSAEAAFLEPFTEAGDVGGILEVSPIHKALCARVGRQVALSTVYDLLHRHGWRKIQPRSRHPKADKEAQADFKKMA